MTRIDFYFLLIVINFDDKGNVGNVIARNEAISNTVIEIAVSSYLLLAMTFRPRSRSLTDWILNKKHREINL